MAERVQLPDGNWVVFRDTNTMTNRQRRPYMDLIFKMQKKTWRPDEDADSAWKWGAASTFMVISEWSRAEPIPTEYDLYVLLLDELPVTFVDPMMLAVSQFLMDQIEAQDPPTKRARKPAAKTSGSPPASRSTPAST